MVNTIYLKIKRKKDKKKKKTPRKEGWSMGGHGWGGCVKHPEEDGKEATSVWRFGI